MAVQSPLPFVRVASSSEASRTPSPAEPLEPVTLTPRSPSIARDSLAVADLSIILGASGSTVAPGIRGPGARVAPQPPPPDFVRHPRARRYVIRVKTDGTVRVTIPRWGSKREALEFVATQRQWILEQQTKIARLRAAPSGPPMAPERMRELRARASRELPQRLLELAARFDLTVSRITIRNQRWRWGSCSRQGHICLNWRLIDMPADVRDYVLIHELMHLRRMDHSRTFWALVAAACPDYQTARRWLREHARGSAAD
jgi:predicted metal-dependent hydrolase